MLEVHFHGEGEDVVLLHGIPVPPETLDPIRGALEASYRVVVPDLHGCGLDPSEALRRLEQALVARGVTRAAVVGHSAGSYRAFQLACSGVVGVTRICALSPLVRLPPEIRAEYEGLAQAMEAGGLDIAAIAAILTPRWFSADYLARNPETERRLRGWFDGLGNAGLIAAARVESSYLDLRPRLSDIEIPVYLRVGAADQGTPPAWAEEIAGLLPNARLDVVPGAAHFLQYEDPVETIRAVRSFLA